MKSVVCNTCYHFVMWVIIVRFAFCVIIHVWNSINGGVSCIFVNWVHIWTGSFCRVWLWLLTASSRWFWRPQFLQVLPFAIHLSLWMADQVRPQFRHSWFAGRVCTWKFWRWCELRNWPCGTIAFTCRLYWLLEICSWFQWRSLSEPMKFETMKRAKFLNP